MARRNGRKHANLATSDYSGCTVYASELVQDFWGDYGTKNEILTRNLQEISKPLGDPYPVKIYNGPQYEQTNACDFELQPTYIGRTTHAFPVTAYTTLFSLDPGIGDASVGCTLIVR